MACSVFYYHFKRLKDKDKYVYEKDLSNPFFMTIKVGTAIDGWQPRCATKVLQSITKLCNGLWTKWDWKVRYRPYKGEVDKIVPNIVARDFVATASNRKWATDVIQINIGSTELYLSPILDMFNGEIISYNISKKSNLEQIYDMLDKAFVKFDTLDDLILHSNQGWQY